MEKPPFAVAPTAGLVDQFFNELTGEGDYDYIDTRGPWNQADEWQFIQPRAMGANSEPSAESPRCMPKARGSKTRNRSSTAKSSC